MKTRAEIYGNEAADLLRTVTMYPGLSEQQLLCFHPGKEDTAKALLSHLERQGRIFQTESGGYFPANSTKWPALRTGRRRLSAMPCGAIRVTAAALFWSIHRRRLPKSTAPAFPGSAP